MAPISALFILVLVIVSFAEGPGVAAVALVSLSLYLAIYGAVLYRLDLIEPASPGLIITAFLWGAAVTPAVAMTANVSAVEALAVRHGLEFADRWGWMIVSPPVEELLKALGVIVLVLLAREHFTSPLDGLIFGGIVGLGFEITENFEFISKLAGDDIGTAIHVFLRRSLAGGVLSHAVYTGIAGYGIVSAHLSPGSTVRKFAIASCWIGVAVAFHAWWNSPWLTPQGDDFGAWVAMPLVKAIPAVLMFVVLVRRSRDREHRWILERLEPERGSLGITDDELDALRSRRRRNTAARAAQAWGGRQASKNVRRLQHLQIRLAIASATGDAYEAESRRCEILAIRSALAAAWVARPEHV